MTSTKSPFIVATRVPGTFPAADSNSCAQTHRVSPAAPARRARFFARLIPCPRVGHFTHNVSVLVGGTAFGQAAVIVASPVLTRLYTPQHFGLLGIFISLMGILTTMGSLRYELAIPLPEDESDAASLLLLCLMLIPGTVLSAAIPIYLLRHNLATWTNAPEFALFFWVLPIGMALSATHQVFTYWAIRNGRFARIARTRMIQTSTGVVAQIALFSLGPSGLLLGHVLGSAIGTAKIAAATLKQELFTGHCNDSRSLTRLVIRHRRFPQLSTLSGLINSSSLLMPTVLLAALFGPLVAGQFALVQRVISWPASLIGTAVAQVYLRESANALHTSPSALHVLFLRTSKRLALVAIPPQVIILAGAPWLFSLIFGSHWTQAGTFARLLAPMVAMQLVARPLSQTLNILDRQTWQLAWDLGRFILGILVFLAAPSLALSPEQVILAYAAAMAVSYLASWALQLAAILTHFRASRTAPHALRAAFEEVTKYAPARSLVGQTNNTKH